MLILTPGSFKKQSKTEDCGLKKINFIQFKCKKCISVIVAYSLTLCANIDQTSSDMKRCFPIPTHQVDVYERETTIRERLSL
jgi:hypothetical protein